MRKDKFVNPVMLIFSIVGGGAAYVFGELLLSYMAYWPYFLQCGVYLLFVTAVCCLVMLISESIHSGNYIGKRQEFGLTCLKAMAIMLPIAFAAGALTQLLYGFVGLRAGGYDYDFQGSYIVCDISGSMTGNDPDMQAVEGMIEYIDNIKITKRNPQYLGVIVYNDEPYVLRDYAPLEDEEQKEELKQILEEVFYSGGTNVQDSLLTAIDQMRDVRIGDWPGIIMLFSDGESEVDYDLLQREALGDIREPGEMIPINTIYYSRSQFGAQLGGRQMSMIAQKTGGTYFYLDDSFEQVEMRDVFQHSYDTFAVEQPHLLHRYFGAALRSPVRIILQVLCLGIWGALTSVAVLVFLNNVRLLRSFVIMRVAISFVCSIIFAIILILPERDIGAPVRAILALSMCLMFLPTYRWDSGSYGNHGNYNNNNYNNYNNYNNNNNNYTPY
jgi:Ca-activated chloride channel family protein